MKPRYFVSMYTDGPSLLYNVIDGQTQEWVRRFPTEHAAQEYANKLQGDFEEKNRDFGEYSKC